jgi:DNA-binding FadR family transcriptional regulator
MYQLRITIVKEELAVYQSIVAAIEKHDPEAAEQAMRSHLGFPSMELKWLDRSSRQSEPFVTH